MMKSHINTAEEAVELIKKVAGPGIKLGLGAMRALSEELEQDLSHIKFVHVVGTNGKGSTVKFISSALAKAGYKVGSYVSPQIEAVNELISVNGEEISDRSFIFHMKRVVNACNTLNKREIFPTEFEILTQIAFEHFLAEGCEIAVVEAGMGGKGDATNIISPILSVICPISLDHTDRLGASTVEIAKDKAGIIKKGCSVCTAILDRDVSDVVMEKAIKEGAPLFELRNEYIEVENVNREAAKFKFKSVDYEIGMAGNHQIYNASLALLCLEVMNDSLGFSVGEDCMREGLREVNFKYRFEQVKDGPIVVLDGAHNPAAAEELRKGVELYFGGRKLTAIFAAMKDKNIRGILKELAYLFDEFILPDTGLTRAMNNSEISDILRNTAFSGRVRTASDLKEAAELVAKAEKDRVFIAFGSLYYLSALKKLI